MRALMVIDPGVEVKTIEGDAAVADWDFRKERPDFSVEPVAVHAQVRGRVAMPDEARKDCHGRGLYLPRYTAVI